MRQALRASLLLAMLAGTLPALAHRQPECLSTLTWDPQAQQLEVTHRLHVHDVERALTELFGTPGLRLADVETRARFALYVESRFALRGVEDSAATVPLKLVGAALEGSALLVYQEYSGPLPEQIEVRSDVLREVSDRQRNQVLVRTPQRTVRLDFADDVSWRQARL
jgi:hypothetical protein